MNFTRQLKLVLLAQLFFILPALYCRAVPQMVNYQGMLTDNSGNPVSKTSLDMRFALYTVSLGGSELWSETQTVSVEKGVFNVRLGTASPFPADLFGDELYLGITVGTGTEMTPRHVLISVPYAFTADDADTLDGMDSTEFGDITDVAAGTGLAGGGTYGAVKLEADISYLQRRVISTCKSGSSIRAVNIDGSVTCEPDDVGITLEIDPTVPGSIKDGIDWNEIGSRPAGLDDGDDVGIISESDPQVGANSSNYVPRWNGSALVTGAIFDNGSAIGIGTSSPNEQLEITGNLRLPATTATTGIIMVGAKPLIHSYGSSNFFAGENAGNLYTTGGFNMAFGNNALHTDTTGSGNTASGYSALYSNTEGEDNTAIGTTALFSNTIGNFNIAGGKSALFSNTIGWGNSAIGFAALHSNATGNDNTALGKDAGLRNIDGCSNTFIGKSAGHSQVHGYNNTFIGYDSNTSLADGIRNATAVGNGTMVDASNHVRIGNSDVTEIGGNVAWSNLSDKRHKKDIRDVTLGIDFIVSLHPVEFTLIDGNDRVDLGFIAQDIETILGTEYNILGIGGDTDRTLSLRYTDFIAPMVKAIQEQQEHIEAQQTHIKSLEERLARLENRLSGVK